MGQEARIKVTLDTKPAEAKLRDLGKKGEATASRVSGTTQAEARGGSSLMKGVGLGAGFAVGRRIAGSVGFLSSIGDVMGEATAGIRADVDAWTTAPLARAQRAAREQTAQDMALLTYHTGDTSAAKNYYNHILETRHLPQQVGASMNNRALGSGRAEDPSGNGPLDKLLDRVVDTIKTGMDNIGRLLGG